MLYVNKRQVSGSMYSTPDVWLRSCRYESMSAARRFSSIDIHVGLTLNTYATFPIRAHLFTSHGNQSCSDHFHRGGITMMKSSSSSSSIFSTCRGVDRSRMTGRNNVDGSILLHQHSDRETIMMSAHCDHLVRILELKLIIDVKLALTVILRAA